MIILSNNIFSPNVKFFSYLHLFLNMTDYQCCRRCLYFFILAIKFIVVCLALWPPWMHGLKSMYWQVHLTIRFDGRIEKIMLMHFKWGISFKLCWVKECWFHYCWLAGDQTLSNTALALAIIGWDEKDQFRWHMQAPTDTNLTHVRRLQAFL